MSNFTLPKLPYAYDALEPQIAAKITEIHYTKHHQTYVNNLNAAYQKISTAIQQNDVKGQIELQQAIRFNGGGHINHSLFWENLAPADSDAVKGGTELKKKINEQYGSFDQFKDKFIGLLLGIQGSGWGWLVKNNESNNLELYSSPNQDPVPSKYTPLIGIDFWEHAYYIQYYNNKGEYAKKIFDVLNWETAEKRWKGEYELKL
ncbi:Superoxide dismutase [Mn], mitochondrial [Wickerhamomyces ciferrii]|uniref:Superoxide dismutase n=1 Tax=Wickerhamomyces ciferrii (strain ATCC 14091 / BCRC 22168 / CBS 111 / JCM 3599 / NBRC 0793 / NRRL Y-1031 F-60-10) TaxID=1206466 RepID=K0KLR4_WICCF|nr:Superoxide dismutase [Mn], mitochondrial [Wickerhamomyces ciferrii]CCH42068.1 Superoxide dismutase [Mn], mitochondrial [Wickerhamomyces ciferrii]